MRKENVSSTGNNRYIDRMVLGLVALLLLLSYHLIVHAEEHVELDTAKLMEGLHMAKVQVNQLVLQHNGTLGKPQSENQFYQFKQKLEKEFGLTLSPSSHMNQRHHELRYQGSVKETINQLQLALIGKPVQTGQLANGNRKGASEFEVHVVIRLRVVDVEQWEIIQNDFIQKLSRMGLEPEVNLSLQGSYDQALNQEERDQFIQDLFKYFEASITEGYSSESVVSLTGYSEHLTRSIESANGLMNLQIAAHVHSDNTQTIITIGHPIIVIEY